MSQDDRFFVRVPLASDEDNRIRELFRAGVPVPWPGRNPEMGYWIESITERSDSAWVEVIVAQAGRLTRRKASA